MGEANSQAKADGPAQTASARRFDCSRAQAERRAATMRLLARPKAIDSKQEAQSARAYASGYVRKQEPLNLRLLETGVGIEEILANLALSFPSISRAALRDAIGQLRGRCQIRTNRGEKRRATRASRTKT